MWTRGIDSRDGNSARLIFDLKHAMKQTNNALTLLQSQYDAVFRQAFFKGLASRTVLKGLSSTLMLSAGAMGVLGTACPAYATDAIEITWGENQDVTISDEQSLPSGEFNTQAKSVTINASGTLNISGDTSGIEYQTLGLYVSDAITINGGNLNITGTDKQLVQVLANVNGDPVATFNMNGGSLTMERASLGTGETKIDGAHISLKNLTGFWGKTPLDTYASYTNLTTGYAPATSENAQNSTLATTISNSTLEIGNQALLNVLGSLTINNTQITLSGDKAETLNSNPTSNGLIDAKAIIRSNDETKIGSGSSITVAEGKTGGLFNRSVTMDGDSSITVSSGAALYIAGKIFNADNGSVTFEPSDKGIDGQPIDSIDNDAQATENAKYAHFYVNSGQINNYGHLVLGANNSIVDNTGSTQKVDVEQNADVEQNGNVEQYTNVEQNSDTELTAGENQNVKYQPSRFNLKVTDGSLNNQGTLDIGVAIPQDAWNNGSEGTNVNFNGGELNNASGAVINIYAGSSLALYGENSLHNQGKIVLHPKFNNQSILSEQHSTLRLTADALDSWQVIKSSDPKSEQVYYLADLASVGYVEGAGVIDLNNASNKTDSTFTVSKKDLKELFKIDLDADLTQVKDTQHHIFALSAQEEDVSLQFDDDLNLSSDKVNEYFTRGNTSGGAATNIGTVGTLNYNLSATNEDLNYLHIFGKDVIFTPNDTEAETVLVSGSVSESSGNTQNANANRFIAAQSVDTSNHKSLTFENSILNLANYVSEDNLTGGQIKVDVNLSNNGILQLEDNQWQAQNINLSGDNSQLIITNWTGQTDSVTGMTAKNITIQNATSQVIVGRNDAFEEGAYYQGSTYLKADKIDMQNGSFKVVRGEVETKSFTTAGGSVEVSDNSTLNIKGDNDSKTLDFNGLGVKIANSTLNLNNVADTIGLTYTAGTDGKAGTFTTADGYTKIEADATQFEVNLDNISGLSSITVEEANSLLGVLASGSGLVHINGTVEPDFDTTTNEQGEQVIDVSKLTPSGSNEIVLDFSTDKSLATTVTGVTAQHKLSGGWRGVETDGSNVTISEQRILSLQGNKDGTYARDTQGNTVGVVIGSGSTLDLNNTGKIGAITGSNGTLNLASGSQVTVVDGQGKAQDVKVQNLQTAGSLLAQNVETMQADLSKGTVLNLNSLKVTDSLVSTDAQINVTQDAALGKNAVFTGTSLVATTGTVSADNLILTGGSSLKAKNITINGGEFRVGLDANTSKNSTANAAATNYVAGTAEVSTENLTLNGGTLIIDPEFSERTASLFAKVIGTGNNTGMKFDGNVVIGKNSALGLGGTEEEFRENLATYQSNGSLNKDIGAYLYVNSYNIELNGKKLIVASEDKSKLDTYLSGSADIYLGTDAGMQVSAKALTGAASNNTQVFAGLTENNTIASTDGTLIVPANMSKEQFKNLFGSKIKLNQGDTIKVTTANGLYTGVIDSTDDLQNGIDMQVSNNARDILSDLSNPTYDYINNIMSAETKTYSTWQDFTNQQNQGSTNGSALYGSNGVAVIENSVGYNFLQDALGAGKGRAIEQSARLAAFGGAMQSLQIVNNSTVDTVNGRLGIGNSTAALTVANNTQGAGLWVTPIYHNFSSDSFDGNGVGYGADVDLLGAALGADFTLANGVRLGAAFNIGSGDADGQGEGSGISNDFNYYGLALYAGFSPIKNLNLGADLNFSRTSNDFSAASGVLDYGNLTASADGTAWSLGVNAQYLIQSTVDIAPHIGMRYTSLDIDDYDVKAGGETIAHTNNDSAQVFSIPVGVSVSKEFKQGDWTIRPAADLTLSLNFGDNELQSSTAFDGVLGDEVSYNTEFMDNITYRAGFGLSAENNNLKFGINAGYTGSSNTDEYSVSANVRLVF